jgi:diguanylate cyclase (GGDEF)-like protein
VVARARTDDLTALLNHGTFQDWLNRSVLAHEPFSLIMLDLDDFKNVNDALGHQAGDLLLAEISRSIEAAGRATDRVFRYGGDEFALILPGTDAASALAVGERIRAAIHALGDPGTRWADAGMLVSVSIGVATFPRDGLSAEEILLAADRACFVAKRTGHGLIATADEGLAIARDFAFKAPTPIDAVRVGGEPGDGGAPFGTAGSDAGDAPRFQAGEQAVSPVDSATATARPKATRKPRRPAADATPVP